jgi:hypothetical protein
LPKPASQTQLLAVEAIRQAIIAEGERQGPASAYRKFPGVPKSTWSRWTIQARQQIADDEAVRQQQMAASALTTASPAAPSIDQAGAPTPGVISWLHQVTMMLEQCGLLAAQRIHTDPATGLRRARNSMVLQQSIRARAVALKLAGDREAVLYGAERVLHWERLLLKEVFRAIGKVRTEDQRVISNRVRKAIDGIVRRRAEEREFMQGDMTPKTETNPTDGTNE